jgi:exopolysaccharide biosynthesis polyprenyl glycosylphosphotransferase
MPIYLLDRLVESPVRHPASVLGSSGLLVLLCPGVARAADSTAGGASLSGPFEIAVVAFAAVVALASLLAGTELAVRIVRERFGSEQPAFPVLSALHAQRLYSRVLYGVAPAAVATAITYVRTQDVSSTVFLLGSMVLTAAVLRSHRLPLHLMPIARRIFNAFVPTAGVALALLPGVFGDSLIDPKTAAAAVLGAIVTTLMAAFLEDRFQGDAPIRLAVLGPASFTEKLTSELTEARIRGYRVVGYLDETDAPAETAVRLGSLDDVRQVVSRHGIDLLVVAPQNPRLRAFEQTAKVCLDMPVRMIEATALYEDVLGHVPIGTINSAWFQFIMHPRYSPSSPLSKRILDLVVSGAMVTAALPVLALCAIAIKLADRGPVFYRQRRIGEEGREFEMVKFRTLRADADQLMATHSEDELITRVGRVLRALHLNELPQLVQVLKGEMSLVGPRPEPPALVRELSDVVPYYRRRALVKPGLTGWAQVRCGYAGTHYGTAWKMCHDLYYIKHRSARLDLLILSQTLRALVERSDQEQLPAEDFILGQSAELVGHR